jgi:glycosyltransferase involved in cell wall biosynthesis
MKPTVTVFIPTYNRAEYLRASITSVLNQTYADFELLISDNASTDHTQDVVESFGDSRIRYHRHASNLGMARNWQFAAKQISTPFGAPLSDDDLFEPDHLETALSALSYYPNAAYYVCAASRIGEFEGELRPFGVVDRESPLVFMPPDQAYRFLGADNPGPMMTMVCHRSALQSEIYWGTPELLPQDVLVMTQLMAQGGFVFGNRPTACYRIHDGNASYRLSDQRYVLRFNLMLWDTIRYVTRFLLDRHLCTLDDVTQHGCTSPFQQHVVPTVLALASYASSVELRQVARTIFETRTDMDHLSARFRLARRLGFKTIPMMELFTQIRYGWFPSRQGL